MSAKTVSVLTFFNNKGGVGKTSLVFHVSSMLPNLGKRVLVVDLDPQANLTAGFLDETTMENLFSGNGTHRTIYQCLAPLSKTGDVRDSDPIELREGLYLLPGDLALAKFESNLATEWPQATNTENWRAMRVLSSLWLVAQQAAQKCLADIIVFDVGPNLGAINRSALIGSDFVVVPVAADLFSLQGLRNLGPTLKEWKSEWELRRQRFVQREEQADAFDLPSANMLTLGYALLQHPERLDRPVRAFSKWAEKLPDEYRNFIGVPTSDAQIAKIRNFRSLMPMAQEARKPIFELTAADGATGANSRYVRDAYTVFEDATKEILRRMSAHIQHSDRDSLLGANRQ